MRLIFKTRHDFSLQSFGLELVWCQVLLILRFIEDFGRNGQRRDRPKPGG
jgi:hypothetical protein